MDDPKLENWKLHCTKYEKPSNPIKIEFNDVSFVVDNFILGKNVILDSISGEFCPGQLSAIMGPSGGGKSTLLNILSGLTPSTSGEIKFNGNLIKFKDLKKFTALVMQDDVIHNYLSVIEIMTIAGTLKLGRKYTKKEIVNRADMILKMLLLYECRETMAEKLSGGERKRLSVALEIIDNPQIIFVDEPTTGLDTVSAKQIIMLLKLLARQGKTIVCSIHQPSALLFEQLDYVYVMGKGRCVYRGVPKQLVPYLARFGLVCPVTYNPADHLLDCIHGENYENIKLLSEEIHNGKRKNIEDKPPDLQNEGSTEIYELDDSAHVTFLMEFLILLKMMMTQKIRNKGLLIMSALNVVWCGAHAVVGFYRIGYDGNFTLYNLHYSIIVVIFTEYTFCMTNWSELFQHIKWLERDHFNRWFSAHSYFWAVNASFIPQNIFIGLLFLTTAYFGSNQELSAYRFFWFFTFSMIGGLIAEAVFRITIYVFNEINSLFVGTITLLVPAAFIGIFHRDHPLHWLSELSFTKMAMNGNMLSLLEDRPPNECSSSFVSPSCFFRDFKQIFKYFFSTDKNRYELLNELLVVYVISLLAVYFVVYFRLNSVYFRKIENFVTKVFETVKLKY